MEKIIPRHAESQSDVNQMTTTERRQRAVKFGKTIKEICMKMIKEAKNKEVQFLFGMPFPIAPVNDTMLNMVIGDAGAGKSLLFRSLMENILRSEDFQDVIVIYLDLEFQDSVAAERNFDALLENERFFMHIPLSVEKLKNVYSVQKYSIAFIKYLSDLISSDEYENKRFIVFIDSFEDFIDDTSDDRELKVIFRELQNLKNTTIFFNHHITKSDIAKALKFRGSMVIKAKLTSMVYLKEKIIPNDNEIGFVLEVLKMRVASEVRNVTAIINKDDFVLKTVKIVDDRDAIFILKNIYFVLVKEKEMLKTELVHIISKKTGKSKQKVMEVLSKHEKFFHISTKEKNAHVYSLTADIDILNEYLALFGLGDISVTNSEAKRELLEYLEKRDPEEDINLEIRYEDKLYVFPKVKTVRYEVHKLNDGLVKRILETLKEKDSFIDTIEALNINF